MQLIKLNDISKSFKEGHNKNIILENIQLNITQKTTTTIVGNSGSGKTTLLNIIMDLESYDSGEIIKHKGININYVTQHAHFIDEISIYDNLFLATFKSKTDSKIEEYCTYFQCEHLLKNKPRNLSGGEKQRVNIIRALLTNPDVLILDEPTAALDYNNKIKVASFLNDIHRKKNISIILVTHDQDILNYIEDNTIYTLKNKNLILYETPVN